MICGSYQCLFMRARREIISYWVASHLNQDIRFWKRLRAVYDLQAEGWSTLKNILDSMWLSSLQFLDTLDAGVHKFSNSDYANPLQLPKLEGRIVPTSCPQASAQGKGVSKCNRILTVEAKVYNASD